MPLRTLLLRRRYWERQRDRRARREKGIRYAYRTQPPPDIIDYWAHIPATKPEKFIFAELIRRGVSFYFSYLFGDMPFTADKEERYRPDFLLPDYRIIIEVAGIYWHTRPGMFEYDVTRTQLFLASGYQVYIFTDQEILDDVVATLDKIPEIRVPVMTGGRVLIGDRPIDPTAAVSARLKRYPKVVRLRYRKKTRGPLGVRSAHPPSGARPQRATANIASIFTHRDFTQDFLSSARDMSTTFLDYVDQLGEFFRGKKDRQRANPDEYRYYLQWKDWWKKFQIS